MSGQEEWRPVPGWEDRYDVSDLGRVRSRTTYHGANRPPRILALNETHGYLAARFFRRPVVEIVRVHRLVLEVFVGPRPEGMVTRHLNGDKTDNRLTNLVYGTHSENLWDSVRHGTHPMARRTHCQNGHEFTPENTKSREGKGARYCITCRLASDARRKLRRGAVSIGGGFK